MLISVPVLKLKPQGQASTRKTTQVDFSDIQDEVHFVSSEAKVEVSDLKHHIVNVS